LQEIDLSLQHSEQAQHASYTGGKELDAAVRNNLGDLQSSVSGASDLTALKETIQTRMENIYAHLQEFRKSEDRHKEALVKEMAKLRTRLGNLESESSDLQERLERERQQAMLDPLTGIMNRIAYDKRLREERSHWKRYKTPLSLIVCDIDKFKDLNDILGHQVGDKALQSITVVLKNNVRETDLLARYGGEEFVILLPNTGAYAAGKAAEKIRLAVEKASFKYQGKRIPVTISCGYAEFHGADSSEDVFQRADKYLYQAKDQGRNCCVGDRPD
jgi:diguanylate cyclase